jgi:hypothetical protein
MKAINLAGIAGVLVTMTAFINHNDQKAFEKLQILGNSKGFAVVELFTSEGCSSCPPAEELVEKIQMENKNNQIYILAYHVDYWDHQGWKDRFGDREFSKRQQQYASWLNLRTVYTPQIVINGTTEYIGSNKGSVLKAISIELNKDPLQTLILDSKIEEGKVMVQYQVAGNMKNSELVLALIQKTAQSNIKGGENSGRSLSHVQIVRKLQSEPLTATGKGSAIIVLPKDLNNQNWEILGLIQDKSNGKISGAAKAAQK